MGSSLSFNLLNLIWRIRIGDFAIVIEFRLDARLKQVLYSTATSGKEGKPPTSMSSFRLILVLRPRRRVLFR